MGDREEVTCFDGKTPDDMFFLSCTPPKTNIEPENTPLEKEKLLQTTSFLGSTLVFGGCSHNWSLTPFLRIAVSVDIYILPTFKKKRHVWNTIMVDRKNLGSHFFSKKRCQSHQPDAPPSQTTFRLHGRHNILLRQAMPCGRGKGRQLAPGDEAIGWMTVQQGEETLQARQRQGILGQIDGWMGHPESQGLGYDVVNNT